MNIQALLQQLNVPVAPEGHHHRTTGWIQIDCPYCSPNSKRFRLGVSKRHFNTNCWSCGPHRLSEVLHEITEKPYQELKGLIGEVRTEIAVDTPARGKLVLPPGVGDLLKQHTNYLGKRGFLAATLDAMWGIRGIGKDGGAYCWRIFIPIHLNGEVVSWTTRSISDEVTKRYHSARPDQEKINHKSLLYGEDYCRHAIVVVEGPTDVWRIGPGAVCTFGTGYSKAQINRMVKYPVRAVCFDREPEAQSRARNLVNILTVFPGTTYLVRLNAKDPGSAPPEEIAKLREAFLEG